MLKPALAILLFSITLNAVALDETAVELISLAPPLDQADAELSGLSWCGSKLVLLPQHPKRLSTDGNSYFYYLERQQIVDYLEQESKHALKAKKIRVFEGTLRQSVSVFDGFESITCRDKKVWLSIEAIDSIGTYLSFVVPGSIEFEQQAQINIDVQGITFLGSQSKLENMGDEAIVMVDDDVISIHEVNDPRIASKAKAQRVTRQSQALSTLSFPHIPFRITDASELDQDNRFWVMNYKYSGDKFAQGATDSISDQHGEGASHRQYYNVERLIELRLEGGEIKLTETMPIALKMVDVEGRNWEGLARLEGRGFLLATDKYPATLLGFVPYPKQPVTAIGATAKEPVIKQ